MSRSTVKILTPIALLCSMLIIGSFADSAYGFDDPCDGCCVKVCDDENVRPPGRQCAEHIWCESEEQQPEYCAVVCYYNPLYCEPESLYGGCLIVH